MMTLAPGSQLARYRIVSRIGSGGMGEVYKAHDPTLGRIVALKILPPDLVSSADRLRRFEQEARAASSLSHPHIVSIYEIGAASDRADAAVHYMAMELIEGRTLREAISEGIPLRDALEILSQVADAVAKAHTAGIIHRDLKPENIMITSEGYGKVLDFGLAKLLDQRSESPADSGVTLHKKTSEGVVVGTPAYMSPEQVRGQQVDHRTDVFSFGSILYEVVTRRRPFEADSKVDVLHQILHDDPPPLTGIAPNTPGELRRLIRRCLAKDPERRYQSMKDIAIELRDMSQEFDSLLTQVRLVDDQRQRRWWWVGVVGVLLLAAAAMTAMRRSGSSTPEPFSSRGRLTQLTRQGGYETYPRISPDGNFIVYVSAADGDRDIYLQRRGGYNSINLTERSPDEDTQPAISRDGQLIAFRSSRDGGGIFVMGATGESVRRVSDFCYDPSWSPTGQEIVCATLNVSNPLSKSGVSHLWILNLATGAKRQVGTHDAVQPSWSPNGHRIAFWSNYGRGSSRDIFTVAPDGTDVQAITADADADWGPVWAGDGRHLYFASDRGGTMGLWRVPIDEKSGRALGPPQALPTVSRWNGPLDVSRDGKSLVFSSAEIRAEIFRVDLDPSGTRAAGPPVPVFQGMTRAVECRISPDGQWLVFRSDGEQEDIFLVRTDGTELRQLTNDIARDRGPSWSPDGTLIAFYSDRVGGGHELWTIRPDGSGLRQVTATGGSLFYPQWSPDGRWLSANNNGGTYLFDLQAAMPLKTATKTLPQIAPGRIFRGFSWSRDGWIAGRSVQDSGVILPGLHVYSLADSLYRSFEHFHPVGDISALHNNRLTIRDSRGDIQLIDLESGSISELVRIGHPPFGFGGLSVSADGRSVYFVRDAAEADIWLLTLTE